MTMWEFLKPKLNIDLVKKVESEARGYEYKNKLTMVKGRTKKELAFKILTVLASNNVAVPICESYGEKQMKRIEEIVLNNKEEFPNLAFVTFTSGTLGEPKGVMLSNENIIENIKGIENYFSVKESEKILICRPLVHIAVITGELLLGLYKGLDIIFYEENFQAKRLAEFICLNKIDILCCTPTIIYHLSNYLSGTSLKTVVLSGELLREKTVSILKNKLSLTKFYNVYGLTENSPRVSALTPKDFFNKIGSVGKPLINTELKIENGELLVKSKSVMQGYLGNRELTEKKISNGYLQTGDMAKIDSEGYLYVLGRQDDMIIRAGVNVYPSEIENVISEFTNVEGCLVYGERDDNYGELICAKVLGNINKKELRKFLFENLPNHLVPGKIEIVKELDLTISGKVKRK